MTKKTLNDRFYEVMFGTIDKVLKVLEDTKKTLIISVILAILAILFYFNNPVEPYWTASAVSFIWVVVMYDEVQKEMRNNGENKRNM